MAPHPLSSVDRSSPQGQDMETRPVPTGRLIEPARALPVPVFSAMGRISFDVGSLASELYRGSPICMQLRFQRFTANFPPERLTLPSPTWGNMKHVVFTAFVLKTRNELDFTLSTYKTTLAFAQLLCATDSTRVPIYPSVLSSRPPEKPQVLPLTSLDPSQLLSQ